MWIKTVSIRFLMLVISRTFCCSSFGIFRILAIKSAIFPGWSMLIILSRISSENKGLFSESCFISLKSALVSASTSSLFSSSSSRYCTAAAMGFISFTILRILKRFCVAINTFTPPSGKLIFLTIFATQPILYRSFVETTSALFFKRHKPIKPSPE